MGVIINVKIHAISGIRMFTDLDQVSHRNFFLLGIII